MNWRVILQQMDEETGVVFPAELVDQLQLRDGDELNVGETKDGILLTRGERTAHSGPSGLHPRTAGPSK